MMKRLWNNEKGFTLMELIIVIVILGILALIAVPRLIGFTDQAEQAADKEYAAVVAKAAELYWASHRDTDTAIGWDDINQTGEKLIDNPAWGQNLQYYQYISLNLNWSTGVAEVGLSTDTTWNASDIYYTSTSGYSTTSTQTHDATTQVNSNP